MKDYWKGWELIKTNDTWKHKKTGRTVIIIETPQFKMDRVKLFHEHSGKATKKQIHYFLDEYKKEK